MEHLDGRDGPVQSDIGRHDRDRHSDPSESTRRHESPRAPGE
jgi:hypothetical protein